jgi:uncharacterized protein Yka (UPF0111/DUF47 family)
MATSVIQHLFPNGNFILDHLHHSADRLHSMSLLLQQLVNETDVNKRKELVSRSAELHQQTKKESRALFETLSKNLITPFDREDIFAMGSGIKTLSSKTDSLIRFIHQNKCNEQLKGINNLVNSFQKGTEALLNAIHGLEKLRNQKQTFEFILDLRDTHTNMKSQCETYMTECFEELDNVKEILINIDLYEYFGGLSMRFKGLSQITEGFCIKYA